MQHKFPNKNRRKKQQAVAQSVASILPTVGRQLKLDQKVQEWAVLSLWEQIVDNPFKTRSRAVRIRSQRGQNCMTVLAANSAVASELTFYLEEYQNRLNRFAADTRLPVHRIEVKLG